MSQQRNLTEENVQDLKAVLEEMKKDNQELEYEFYRQDSPLSSCCNAKVSFNHATGDNCCSICGDRIGGPREQEEPTPSKKLFEKLEAIERKIDLISSKKIKELRKENEPSP